MPPPLQVPSNKVIEAQSLLEQAEKRANAFSFFGLAGSTQTKLEDASDMCAKAGNLLKTEKQWKEAGDAYVRSADYLVRINDRDEAANRLLDAAKCFKKTSPDEAVRVLVQAVDMLKEKGRFHSAAGYVKQIAETYETDQVDLQQALRYYEEAGELYSGEDSGGMANQCFLKVATLAAQLEQYDKAIERFEQVAAASLTNNLTKFSVKEYLLKAGLCQMCKDTVNARQALERYQDMDATFGTTRECQLLKDLLDAFEAGDVPVFTKHVADYDRLTKLDNWKTTIMLRIKKMIAEEPSLT